MKRKTKAPQKYKGDKKLFLVTVMQCADVDHAEVLVRAYSERGARDAARKEVVENQHSYFGSSHVYDDECEFIEDEDDPGYSIVEGNN